MRTQLSVLAAVGALVTLAVVTLAGCGGSVDTANTTSTGPTSAVPFDGSFIDAMASHERSAVAMAKGADPVSVRPSSPRARDNTISTTRQAEIDEMLKRREASYGSRGLNPGGAMP
jgi:uncharacterized protein (DUF305 family)